MSQMHPDTLAALRTRLLAEIAGDPAYDGLGAADLAVRLNAPVVVAQAPVYRDVSISDVRGYLETRLVLVRLEDWIADPATPKGTARDAARTLLRVTSASGLSNFTTSTDSGRANILGLFALLVSTGAGGLTQAHYDDIAAMTIAPAGPPAEAAPRWSVMIEGLADAPNAADPGLIAELLA